MERVIVSIEAKNKSEAVIGLEMALKTIEKYSDMDEISECVCVTNEGEDMKGK